MKQGVYRITNTVTGDTYIGSSINISRRWIGHKNKLKNGNGINRELQEAWDNYGPTAFTCEVLEAVESQSDLLEIEQRHIQTLRPTYNTDNKAKRTKPTGRFKTEDEDKERFWSKVDKQENGCWIWTAPLVKIKDLPEMGFWAPGKKRPISALRLACELTIRKLGPREHIEQGCGNPLCINPHHAQPSVRRFCSKGHELTDENTYLWKSKYGDVRRCRTCRAEQRPKHRKQ